MRMRREKGNDDDYDDNLVKIGCCYLYYMFCVFDGSGMKDVG